MAELYRYAAFISYSSKDAAFARRLHRALERYCIPSSLGKFDLIGGGKKNRIYPVFRDREELGAGELGERIEAALKASAALIVVCSPSAAASPWVQKEIDFFAALNGRKKIFAVVSDTAPLTDDAGADCTAACFPPALRHDGSAEAAAFEPLAGDGRKGKDGFHHAWLKVVAGLIDQPAGKLLDREKRRGRQQTLALTLAVVAGTAAISLSMEYANSRSMRAELSAFAQSATAQGRPLEAIPFALAVIPAPGALLRGAGPDADVALLRTGGTSLRFWDLGVLQRYAYETSTGGHFLATADTEDMLTLRDLSTGAVTSLGKQVSFQFDPTGRFLYMHGPDGAALRDLNNGSAIALGEAGGYRFSPDGEYLFLRDAEGDGTLRNLRTGEVTGVGNVDASPSSYEFSRGGQYLLTVEGGPARNGFVRNLTTGQVVGVGAVALRGGSFAAGERHLLLNELSGRTILVDLRDMSRVVVSETDALADFSSEGKYLVVSDPPYNHTIRNLRNNFVATLGGVTHARFTADNSRLVMLYARGGGGIMRLADRHLTELPDATDFDVAWAGASVLVYMPNQSALYDFDANTRHELGPLDDSLNFFSASSRRLAYRRTDGTGVVRDLAARRSFELGPVIQFAYVFDRGGPYLFSRSADGAVALRYLEEPLPALRGAALRGEVCRVSGEGIRPFAARVREGTDAQFHDLYRRLRGRPWHPCDWRGLFAFENGWEGLRQWIRLIGIRYFGAADYRCGEANARGQASRRRTSMCEIARQPPSLPDA